jgi:hypothetical protein
MAFPPAPLPHTFAVTFINDDSAATTAGLEIYIEFRD